VDAPCVIKLDHFCATGRSSTWLFNNGQERHVWSTAKKRDEMFGNGKQAGNAKRSRGKASCRSRSTRLRVRNIILNVSRNPTHDALYFTTRYLSRNEGASLKCIVKRLWRSDSGIWDSSRAFAHGEKCLFDLRKKAHDHAMWDANIALLVFPLSDNSLFR